MRVRAKLTDGALTRMATCAAWRAMQRHGWVRDGLTVGYGYTALKVDPRTWQAKGCIVYAPSSTPPPSVDPWLILPARPGPATRRLPLRRVKRQCAFCSGPTDGLQSQRERQVHERARKFEYREQQAHEAQHGPLLS